MKYCKNKSYIYLDYQHCADFDFAKTVTKTIIKSPLKMRYNNEYEKRRETAPNNWNNKTLWK